MPKKLILYVDNDHLQLDAMVHRLEAKLNCRVVPAASIDDGIRQIDHYAKTLDLVISDMHFGDEDKEGGLRIVKHASDRRNIPVIVLTGKGNTSNAVRSMEAGAFSYVEKSLEDDATVPLLIYKAAHAFKRRKLEAALKQREGKDRAKAKRLAQDLKRARQLQSTFWPQEPLITDKWEIHGRCEPCDEIGGDFYSFARTHDNAVSIVIGDAMGHGVSAALLGASVKSVIDSARVTDPRAEIVLEKILNTVTLAPPFSATLFYGFLEPKGCLSYFSAGHLDGLLLRRDGELECLRSTGLLLSDLVLKGLGAPRTKDVWLHDGDRLILYTDGITEAKRGSKTEFGIDRFKKIVQSARELSPQAALHRCFAELNQFTQDSASDDRTIVIIDYLEA